MKDIENMSDGEFEQFVLEQLSYYDAPYDGLSQVLKKIEKFKLEEDVDVQQKQNTKRTRKKS